MNVSADSITNLPRFGTSRANFGMSRNGFVPDGARRDGPRRVEHSGVEGRFHEPVDTDYACGEGAYVDADGNLLRYGSALRPT